MRATPLILFLLGCTAPTTDVQPHALGSESPFGLDVEMSWPNERASDLQLVHDSGTGSVRLVLFWGGFEPNPPTGEPSDVMGHKSGDHTYNWNWAGFAPSLNYTYLRNFSNISLYDYDSHALDFRLTKDF